MNNIKYLKTIHTQADTGQMNNSEYLHTRISDIVRVCPGFVRGLSGLCPAGHTGHTSLDVSGCPPFVRMSGRKFKGE